MKKLFPILLFTAAAAAAGEIEVTVEIPRLSVAEYHRPYIALWVEDADRGLAANLAVWYQLDDPDKREQGTTWLKDLRAWWRKGGRDLTFPVDGVSGASRPPGTHTAAFVAGKSSLGDLPPGSYTLMVEASREVGGRELLRIPFEWPKPAEASAQGERELGLVQLKVTP